MKSWKLSTGILFVFVGFFAGVGFNFLPSNTIVRAAPGAPDAPPAALKSVTHDATLKGDGTTTAPLGIASGGVGTGQLANRAVTAPKLSAVAPPAAGNMLGFNGANLAWQAPPVGGVSVVDSRGQVVGPFVQVPTGNAVLRQIRGFLFRLGVGNNGFQDIGNTVFYHTTLDCSETRYYPESGTQLWRNSGNTSTHLFYAADPPEQIIVNSFEHFPADPSQRGRCDRVGPYTATAGLATWINLSTLVLFPPFRIEF